MKQHFIKQSKLTAKTAPPLIHSLLLGVVLFFFTTNVLAQKYMSRTAHVHVKSNNRITNIEADNYQVAAVLDSKSGKIEFIGLLKSFEFKLGAADQLFNSKMVDVSAHPNIKFTGQIADIHTINFAKPGNYKITVNGILYLWNEKRTTSAEGTLKVNADGTISGISEFIMMIEESSVAKINQIMKEKLPSAISVDTETLGISRKIDITLNMTCKAR